MLRTRAHRPAEGLAADLALDQARRAAVETRRLTMAIALLFAICVAALVWAALRHEAGETRQRLEQDVAEAAHSLRSQLLRDAQTLQLLAGDPRNARNGLSVLARAAGMLAERPDIALIELRDADGQAVAGHASPVARALGLALQRQSPPHESAVARLAAVQGIAPVFSGAHFVPLPGGMGQEVIDLWVPLAALEDSPAQAERRDALRVVYTLQGVLAERLPDGFARAHDLALTEADGTFLARRTAGGRGKGVYVNRALVSLPGAAFVLRADSVRGQPKLIPNLLTGMVIALSLALLGTLARLVRDVQRRARAEAALRREYAFRHAMEDSLVTGLRARDLAGRVTYVNRAFCDIVGWPAESLVGRSPPMPYWAPEAMEETRQRHAQVLAGRVSPTGYETVFMRQDGTRVPVLIHEAPLIENGRHTGWMASVVDLTERRRAEERDRQLQEQLQRASRMATMGELATVLSHELNQPLSAISSYATGAANLLDASTDTAPRGGLVRDALGRIATQAQRAGLIIRRVNDFMKRRPVCRERLDAVEVVQSLQPLIELQVRRIGVRFRLRLPDGARMVMADRVMLEQVVLNLTRNAVDAMREMPAARRELDVALRDDEAGGALHVEVSDRGTGITPEVAEKLFTPFYTTKEEGLGMGLAICRSVAEQAGGRLAHRPREGGGTVFTLTLPLATDDATEAARRPAPLEQAS